MIKNRIAVIGGGASGIMAAIAAARSGADVTLFEANDRIGKKILVTGNGRCNLSNKEMNSHSYSSDDLFFVNACLKQFSTKETINFFQSIGVILKEKNGGLYPVTETATTILDALRFALNRYQVDIKCDYLIKEIQISNHKYKIVGCEKSFDKVIVATGLYAGKKTEQAKYGIEIAKKTGHHIISILPALVQLQCEGTYFKSIAGVRTNCTLSSYSNGIFLEKEKGELQLTNYGLSGIPIFQLSSMIAKELAKKNTVTIQIDFIPWIKKEEISGFISSRTLIMKESSIEEFTNGIVHKKIIQIALNELNLSRNDNLKNISDKKIIAFINLLKNWNVKVIKTNSFEQAQVCTGGISIKDISPFFESKMKQNMYFVGELLNVDGLCGGYNLQWAWTSGSIAGTHAALS